MKKSDAELQKIRGRAISMVFQDPLASLNPVFTVGEQIRRVIREHSTVGKREAIELTRQALTATGLPANDALLRSYPHQLSGGMRQRVCMAMAISSGAMLLIADEPTTALDVTIQAQILRLLLRLRDEHDLAQILVTHNVAVAAQACDRVAVMYAGTVVEQGPTESIMKSPDTPTRSRCTSASPTARRRGIWRPIPGAVPDLIDPPAGCRYHPRCAHVMEVCSSEKPCRPTWPMAIGRRVHHVAAMEKGR